MIRISKDSRLAQEEILQAARKFFGRGGYGLEETESSSCCIRFEGGGGYVLVTLSQQTGRFNVDVEAREWEHPARKFLEVL